ncbi:hypothetical protein ACGFWI_07620 [Streptomyces sp. NPDC048434]|uniref:hypothetical protein n=1 Tax=Streptomyces sp. NPDC048434 TaxID=3365549 RepID=UPI0037166037
MSTIEAGSRRELMPLGGDYARMFTPSGGRSDRPGGQPLMQVVFRARQWSGTPEVREPDKCTGWGWWHPDELPAPIVPYTRAAIEGIRAGRLYTEMGWS